MADPKDETPDVDSSGVYFISIEDFERRPKKKRATEDGAEAGQEASSEDSESSERE